jgi:hypothetical protein
MRLDGIRPWDAFVPWRVHLIGGGLNASGTAYINKR